MLTLLDVSVSLSLSFAWSYFSLSHYSSVLISFSILLFKIIKDLKFGVEHTASF